MPRINYYDIAVTGLVSILQNEMSEVNIIPDSPTTKTTFATDSGGHSFSGVVDYLFARVPPKHPCKHDLCIVHRWLLGLSFILENPITALANH